MEKSQKPDEVTFIIEGILAEKLADPRKTANICRYARSYLLDRLYASRVYSHRSDCHQLNMIAEILGAAAKHIDAAYKEEVTVEVGVCTDKDCIRMGGV